MKTLEQAIFDRLDRLNALNAVFVKDGDRTGDRETAYAYRTVIGILKDAGMQDKYVRGLQP